MPFLFMQHYTFFLLVTIFYSFTLVISINNSILIILMFKDFVDVADTAARL
jgi:hypothetical protein